MKTNTLPLKEKSITEIYNGEIATYEVPIYQRNYAWEKDEISALIQDVYDAYNAGKKVYYIGTLVTFYKGDNIYEVIDGQQRLTTIYLVLKALNGEIKNKLTYRARKKSSKTIKNIPDFKIDFEELDTGIKKGFKYAQDAIREIVPEASREEFKSYFQVNVHIIHYQVPKDIDLNHYFEIMNSRGEQLEKHEIIKTRLIEKLDESDKAKLNRIWESCSEMNVYIQQKYGDTTIFGKNLCEFKASNFGLLPVVNDNVNKRTINELINSKATDKPNKSKDRIDTFQPIIDFSNFLLIVLKLTRIEVEKNFDPTSFNLDDKELINEFDKVHIDENFVKKYTFNLLKAKFLLDNYIVHHSNEDESTDNNPWKLQFWQKGKEKNGYLKNRTDDNDIQEKLVHLLSMFEVSFTARQRKNYLFYCLLYLFHSSWDIKEYCDFVTGLADKYFKDVYLVAENLNEINTPKPGSFDKTILSANVLDIKSRNNKLNFSAIFGDGTVKSKGIPLFVFNYLDYKLWEKYLNDIRGKNTKEGDDKRKEFFATLGCSDFGLKLFDQFYFSRTRRTLEHFYPQSWVNKEDTVLNENQINCFGNYAMIGSEINSSGSDWSPITKLQHYLDASGKIKQVSVASIKFMIMMQKCKNNQNRRVAGQEWNFEDIKEHQKKMVDVILGRKK